MIKAIFIIILTVHGLIHLLGFFKEWKIAEIKEMSGETSFPMSPKTAKIFGAIWFIACVTFILSAVMVWENTGWWWMTTAMGILVSQILITIYWKDAKAGTAANAIILLFVLLASAYWNFDRRIDAIARKTIADAKDTQVKMITEEMLTNLPAPVQRYMNYTGVIGRTIPSVIRLKQNIKFKMAPDAKWMALTGEEYYTIDPPALVWKAESANNNPFPLMLVRDYYTDNHGSILGKLLSIIPVAEASGEEIDQGAMLRYLNEIMWFPEAYFSEYISWTGVNDSSAQVKFSYKGKSVFAMAYFDAEGKMVDFTADRYRMTDGGCVLSKWSTPITEYKKMNGLTLPVSGQGVWKLPDGDFAYIDLTVNEIEYDEAEIYE